MAENSRKAKTKAGLIELIEACWPTDAEKQFPLPDSLFVFDVSFRGEVNIL
tara:strand:- start:151372 stop:151524 length:153 start_codon:yes stop_codon:yes gene_type:complete